MIGVVKSFDTKWYTIETSAYKVNLVDTPEEIIKEIYLLPVDKVYEILEEGDIISFVPGQLYFGGKLINLASFPKKENKIAIKN